MQGQFLSLVKAGLNSEFSFSLTSCLSKTKEPRLNKVYDKVVPLIYT